MTSLAEIAVFTDDVAAASAFYRCLLVEARDHPWGRSAYPRDPSGRLVELAQA